MLTACLLLALVLVVLAIVGACGWIWEGGIGAIFGVIALGDLFELLGSILSALASALSDN